MDITSGLDVYVDFDMVFQITSDLEVTAEHDGAATLATTSELYVVGNGPGYGYASANLPALVSFGMEENLGFGRGVADLPALTQETSTGGFYVPSTIVIGWALLPAISNVAIGIRSRAGTGSTSLPALLGLGGDFQYGVGQASLPALKGFGMYGLGPLEANMVDYLLYGSTISTELIMSVVFISNGTISDTMSLTRIQAVEFLSQLVQSDTMTVLGTFSLEMLSTMTAESRRSESVIGIDGVGSLDLDDSGAVWVVNTETSASSQYEKYGFNSFFVRGGVSYGVANDGIYKLTGDDDVGLDIESFINFGRSNFGTSFMKKTPYVYVGIGSNGTMYLKVDVDGSENIYEMRSSSESIKNHRVDPGKGLEGNYWNFILMNKEGANFVIDTVQFKPLISSRRI